MAPLEETDISAEKITLQPIWADLSGGYEVIKHFG